MIVSDTEHGYSYLFCNNFVSYRIRICYEFPLTFAFVGIQEVGIIGLNAFVKSIYELYPFQPKQKIITWYRLGTGLIYSMIIIIFKK